MPRANTVVEIDVKIFDRPRTFVFRGRSLRALAAALRREAERSNPQLGRIASLLDTLAAAGWRFAAFRGQVVTLVHAHATNRAEAEAFLSERVGPDLLARISVRERVNGPSVKPPRLPKADDELSREIRRLVGAESHKKDLYLGHPTEELAELLLDMSFLAQEAMDDPDVARLLDRLRAEHEEDQQYRDLHSRYLSLTERTGMGHPAAEEAYWDLFSYTAHKLSRLIPALRGFLERRGFSDLCEHEATAFLTAALSLALSTIEADEH
ncbi:MAG: hypothetical protein QN131_04975 [Armatimonadota bacterium]|nr:hypothetical protein [Armatimonadota bacterium]MDR7549278.1 hypothetical protein [Armatimonadota bacterium]